MELAERFEENRPRLRAVAYRMLGSQAEADDAVQEAWLRLSRAGGAVGGEPRVAARFRIEDGRIAAIDVITDPGRLAEMVLVSLALSFAHAVEWPRRSWPAGLGGVDVE